jgi:succinylglutamate desuccinylase
MSCPPAREELVLGERIIGCYESARDGPLFVVSGGLHGNEPAGLEAIRRVLARLAERELPLRGRMVGFAGNLAALLDRKRYIDRDLNRDWGDEDIRRLLDSPPSGYGAEDHEQRALVQLFDDLEQQTPGSLVHLDLHSTSGDSAPFVCMADTLRNRRIAVALPVPVLFGLEESIDGTLNSFLTQRGHTALALEGGRHDHPDTTLNHESAIWMALVAAGNLDQHEVPGYAAHRQRLAEAAATIPRYLEIQHRHPVSPDDAFEMRPGFVSFQPVYQGELLAADRNGPIASPSAGLLLMPLYQQLGDDGFFLARPMSGVRLYLSTLVRTLRLEWVLYLVRGLKRHPDHRDRWIVSARANDARMRTLLALFGYRREFTENGRLVVARRRPGFMGRRGGLRR